MNISALTLRNLEYIVAVSDQGHFGRAAESCGVSQPALSAQIQKTEESLGIQIFDRTKRSLHLTSIGAEIVEQARLVLREAGKLIEIAEFNKQPLSGFFRLGVIATLGPYLMPHLLKPLRKNYPALELILVEGLTNSLLEQLWTGRLDAVLLSLPVKDEVFEVEELFVEPFYLVAPSGHRLAKTPELSLEMLDAEEMLLLEDGHCLRDQALDVCHTLGRWQRNRYQATSLETLRHMVASGAGYTLFPALASQSPAKLKSLIKFRPFTKNIPGRTVGLVWRKGSSGAADSHEFSKFVAANLPSEVNRIQ